MIELLLEIYSQGVSNEVSKEDSWTPPIELVKVCRRVNPKYGDWPPFGVDIPSICNGAHGGGGGSLRKMDTCSTSFPIK